MKLILNTDNKVMGFHDNWQNVLHLYPENSIEKIVPDKTNVKEDGTYEIPELGIEDKKSYEKDSLYYEINNKINVYSGSSAGEKLDNIIEAIDLTRKEAKNSASSEETKELDNFKKIKDYIKQLRTLQKSLEFDINNATSINAINLIVNNIVWPNLPNI